MVSQRWSGDMAPSRDLVSEGEVLRESLGETMRKAEERESIVGEEDDMLMVEAGDEKGDD